MSYTFICNLGAVPERFDRVTKHFTVDEGAKCIVTARSVFCFLQNTVHTEENTHTHTHTHTHTVTHVYRHLVHRQTVEEVLRSFT